MQATKITMKTGQYIIIADRAAEPKFSCAIKHLSSTELQPSISVNHDATGKAIGGTTLTAAYAAKALATAVTVGATIEQIEI
jgi:hypothetical protein